MVKTKEIKEIRKIIKEIERESNNHENNINSFEILENLRFLNPKRKILKKKDNEKLEEVIEDELVKDENAKDDLFKSRENLDEKDELRNVYGANKDGDSQKYYRGNRQQADTTGRNFIGDNNLNRQGIIQGNENNLRQTENNTNYERNYVQNDDKEKKKRDLM